MGSVRAVRSEVSPQVRKASKKKGGEDQNYGSSRELWILLGPFYSPSPSLSRSLSLSPPLSLPLPPKVPTHMLREPLADSAWYSGDQPWTAPSKPGAARRGLTRPGGQPITSRPDRSSPRSAPPSAPRAPGGENGWELPERTAPARTSPRGARSTSLRPSQYETGVLTIPFH